MEKIHALFAGIIALFLSFTGGSHTAPVNQPLITNVNSVSKENTSTATSTVPNVSAGNSKNQELSVHTARDILFSGTGKDSIVVKKVLIDGTINQGKFSGYNRVVVVAQSDSWFEPGNDDGVNNFILVTKDFKTYILDKSLDYFMTGDSTRMSSLVTISTDTIPFDFPKEIAIGSFFLEQGSVDLFSEVKEVKKVNSSVPGLTYYITAKSIFVENTNGLRFEYFLVPKETHDAHKKQPDWNSGSYRNYYFDSSEIITDKPLYKTYGTPFPGACGIGGGSLEENALAKEQDLQVIGKTTSGSPVYIPVLADSQFIKLGFSKKIASITDMYSDSSLSALDKKTRAEKEFSDLNNLPIPSFEKYRDKNPILFLKDPWGRFVAVGEWDYKLMGGCGKPVIYLYPKKDTEVSIRLDTPTTFTTQIPSYHDEWKVLAHPNGILTDLQTEYTDCATTDGTKTGSEYARDACLANQYPYLYWSGNVQEKYPNVEDGWIVDRNNLQNFLEEKLTAIGFSTKERRDFLEYWVPEMLKKDSNNFRVSFITTKRMDSFIPMSITPKPDSVYRLFMDWEPITENTILPHKEQILPAIQRDGFTLIEWGGLHPGIK